jgi:hypothetical protein
MNDPNQLNGRKCITWRAQSPRDARQWQEDVNHLADAVAEVTDVFDQQGKLIFPNKDGELVSAAGPTLREIISARIVFKQLVNRGSADKPHWIREYIPFVPSDLIVRTLLTAETRAEGSLLARAPKA